MKFAYLLRIMTLFSWISIQAGSFSFAVSVRDSMLQGVEEATSPTEKGDLLVALSRYYRRINLDSSQIYVEQALKVARDAGLEQKVQRYKMSQAALFWMQSNLDGAAKNYREALAYWRKKRDKVEVTRCLLNLGTVSYSAGTPKQAIEYLSEASLLARETGEKLMEAQIAGTMGSVYYSLEILDSSLYYRQAALEAFAALKDTANMVRSETNLGLHFRDLGQSLRARIHYEQAVEYLTGVDDIGLRGEVYEGLGQLEYRIGDQEAAVKNLLKAREYFRDLGWNQNIAYNNILVGLCFKALGRTAAAKEQFEEGFALADSIGNKAAAASAIANIGEMQRAEGNFREAIVKYRESLRLNAGDTVHADFFSRYLGMGLCMKELGMTDSADHYLGLAFDMARRHQDHFELGTGLHELASVAYREENFRECVYRIDSALKWFSVDKNPRGLHDAFALKSECLEKMGDFVGALAAQRQAARWRDSIFSADATESLLALEAQLWTEKNQHYLDLSEKQKELKTKEAQIARNKSERLAAQRNWLITIFILLLAGGGITWYLNRKRRQNNMQRKISELRIAALRAQMNPHFIFNALGSVQLLINTQKSREANMYLSSFARLLRTILENSGSATLSLEDELEALRLYVQLEALRFKFEYQLEVDEEINAADVRIPGMLIQPLIENAIKHGISGKHNEGRLKVLFQNKNGQLLCIVEDNGIGRTEAGKISRESGPHRSIGIQLIREQLDLIRPFRKDRLSILDLTDADGNSAGTRIEILLEMNHQ